MSLRPAHGVLLGLAVACLVGGAAVIAKGLAGGSEDSTLWNYVAFGGWLCVPAAVLVAFVVWDARRAAAKVAGAKGR